MVSRSVTEITSAARVAVASESGSFERLGGGISHHVFAVDSSTVVKVYRSWHSGEPDREWAALGRCEGVGIAPAPVAYDTAEPPVVVMARVAGKTLPCRDLTTDHMLRIGRSHRQVHALAPPATPFRAGTAADQLSRTRAMFAEWDPSADHLANTTELVRDAGHRARQWLDTDEPDGAVTGGEARFCRGDPNLSNYLWTDEGLHLVDWEDSGVGDPIYEAADMAEHLSTRELGDDMWEALADGSGIGRSDGARLMTARRLVACFWLVVLERRRKRGDAVFQLTLEDQAERVVLLLS